MLGLGLGVQKSAPSTKKQDFFIEQDNIPVGYFGDYSIDGTAPEDSLTYTADQSAPDSSTGWLKIQYPDSDQTSISGINKGDLVEAAATIAGRKFRVQFDVFLETAANWTEGAGNNTVTLEVLYGNTYFAVEVTPDQATSVSTGIQTVSVSGQDRLTIFFRTAGDLPEANATWYIKNFKIRQGKNDSIFP